MNLQKTNRLQEVNAGFNALYEGAEAFSPAVADIPQNVSKDERAVETENHSHNGEDSLRISLRDIEGLIEVVTVIPTAAPTRFFDQFKIYYNPVGPVRRLYVYVRDTPTSGAWRYTVLT